ncbi:MAG TPA: endonuclease/exonuclease/phosphatase family protein [Caldimonas sp.]
MLRIVVAALLAPVLALTVAQQLVSDGPWWLELSRYLPYPLLVAPAVVALLLSLRLGWRWRGAGVATIALFATVAMGLVWNADPDAPAVDVRFMTYNVKALLAIERPGGLAALAAEVEQHHPDIVAMQDSSPLMRGRDPARPGPMFGLPVVHRESQYVIASRWPLRDCATGRADAGGETLLFARCSVERPGGAFELVDVHLESPRRGLVAARKEGIDGIDLWASNHAGRLAQARALAAVLKTNARPLVLGGDLNAPDSSAVIQSLLAVGLRDAFASGGRGYGYTYGHTLRARFSFLRIDHVLVSGDVEVVRAFVGGKDASEHRPVIADLRFPRR